jgi:subtilisin family serine protease
MGHIQANSSDGKVHIHGIVLERPDNENGHGQWTIRGKFENQEHEQVYIVNADEKTDFSNGIPDVNESVQVEGQPIDSTTVKAHKIAAQSDSGHHDGGDKHNDEIQGLVDNKPADPSGIGTWIIRVETDVTTTVVADTNTRFDKGVPNIGDWVEVKGTPQPDGSILADRIRPDEFEDGELVIRLQNNVISTTFASKYGLTPLQAVLPSANIYLFATQHITDDLESVINTIHNDQEAVWAELNYRSGIPEGNPYNIWEWGGLDASGYVNQQAFRQIHLPTTPTTYTGDGIIVAVLDTGVGITTPHPALTGHLMPGWDMVDDDPNPYDEPGGLGWGHGTHVAGIISHIAPNSKILPVRVLNPQGRGNSFVLAYAIEWAVNQGADVINLSLGTAFDSQVLRETVKWATDQGVVVVAAAGNLNSTQPQYPAKYDKVIGVTGVDEHNIKASFASYGAGWVDIAAPGQGITSTIVGPQGNGYASWSGTSMATSFVSGAAALGRQKFATTPLPQFEQKLKSTADNIDALNPDYAGMLGSGLVDVSKLLGINDTTAPLSNKLYLPFIIH